jgi:hypothetical protein
MELRQGLPPADNPAHVQAIVAPAVRKSRIVQRLEAAPSRV